MLRFASAQHRRGSTLPKRRGPIKDPDQATATPACPPIGNAINNAPEQISRALRYAQPVQHGLQCERLERLGEHRKTCIPHRVAHVVRAVGREDRGRS